MCELLHDGPSWYRASTLSERLESMRVADAERTVAPADEVRAEKAFRKWFPEVVGSTGLTIERRLALEGIDVNTFRTILGDSDQGLRRRFAAPLPWLGELTRAYAESSPRSGPPEPADDPAPAGFSEAVRPLIDRGIRRLRESIRPLLSDRGEHPFDPGALEGMLLAGLPEALTAMASRTLVLELHVARLQGQLAGDSPEARFRSFAERLRRRDVVLGLLAEYPVLARHLVGGVERWLANARAFVRDLLADWAAIRTTFCPDGDPGRLTRLDRSVGDPHRGGRTVRIAEFESGFRIVYKPRSLAIDVHFQGWLQWINAQGQSPAFRTLGILDRSGHGWAEHIEAWPCRSREDARRYYRRLGGMLAILHALEATDFHYENLIACGEHPIPIDLETFFQPRIDAPAARHADDRAREAAERSVLRTGLLPLGSWTGPAAGGIDLSGLGAAEGQVIPDGVPAWDDPETDRMRWTHRRAFLAGGRNRPRLDGRDLDVADYEDELLGGFADTYYLILEHRDDLLRADGPLARFAGDEVRVLFRSTTTYGRLLSAGFHPDVLGDALARDRLFDRLWIGAEVGGLTRLVPSERRDLHEGDIPVFHTRAGSRDLWDGAGARFAGYFPESGLSRVFRRLATMDSADLATQGWFIRAALATLCPDTEPPAASSRRRGRSVRRTSHDGPPAEPARGRLVAAARRVGDRLAELALHGDDDATWIGLHWLDRHRRAPVPLGPGLHDGVPGIALFLAYLGAETAEGRYTELARRAVATLRRQIGRGADGVAPIGGFEGWGGAIYGLTHLGSLWEQPDLLAEADDLVARLIPSIGRDVHLDVIGGAAGCIGALAGLHGLRASGRALDAATRCGDRILACGRPAGPGIGWTLAHTGSIPLAGFAHGAAGIAWALLQLAALTGDRRYRETALRAIAYERSLFAPDAGNWPDLRADAPDRPTPGGRSFMTAWCHGAPGIGLARLAAPPEAGDPQTRAEIEVAVRTTLAHGFGANHSLCHGDLGNLDLLLQATRAPGGVTWEGPLRRHVARLLDEIEMSGWRCGVPGGVETPGLMTGLAGIGYGLLRLASPDTVPSVLVLEPPRGRRPVRSG